MLDFHSSIIIKWQHLRETIKNGFWKNLIFIPNPLIFFFFSFFLHYITGIKKATHLIHFVLYEKNENKNNCKPNQQNTCFCLKRSAMCFISAKTFSYNIRNEQINNKMIVLAIKNKDEVSFVSLNSRSK